MSIAITCPKCRATLKAKRAPAPDQMLQCLRCRHWFSLDETAISPKPTTQPAPPPRAMPVARPGWQHKVLAAMVALALVGVGIGGTMYFTRPTPTPPTPKQSTPSPEPVVAQVKQELPAKKPESAPIVKDDPTTRNKFIKLM